MKKFLYLLIAVAGAGFAACSDQNDVVNDLVDEIKNKPVAKQLEYTLTAADYGTISTAAKTAAGTDAANVALAEAVGKNLALNEFATAGDFVPAILTATFPALKDGSTVQVSYAYTEPYLANLAPSPAKTVLAQDFTSAATGSAISVGGWTQFDATGTGQWKGAAYSGNNFAEVSSFGNPAEKNAVYLISPRIDLTAAESPAFTFDAEVRYPVAGHDYLRVLVATDYDAAAKTATWTDVTSRFTLPTAQTNALANAGMVSLADYKGQRINIAFKYQGDDTVSPALTTTLRIDNIKVLDGDTSVTATPGAAYLYDNTSKQWSLYAGGISPTAADYTAMGAVATAPYLSADDAPSRLPVLLAQKFPYAQEGEIKAVTWNTSGTASMSDEYIFTGGRWVRTVVGNLATEQAIYTDGKGWWFDPTVSYTMVAADYQMVVDDVANDPVLSVYFDTGYKNQEWYYGFGSRYSNVNFRPTGSASSSRDVPFSKNNDTELHALDGDTAAQAALLWKRLEEKGMPQFLAAKYPKARVQVSGTDVIYNIGVAVYYPDGVTNTTLYYIMTYKVATAGASGVKPTFTLVERKEVPQAELP